MASATGRLCEAGVASPRVDAELLACNMLGIERRQLLLVDTIDEEQCQRYLALIERRAARVPLQHLTGTAPFRLLELAVGPGVFVPRPETELLVEWGLDRLAELDASGSGASGSGASGPTVVDLCSGSGAIAVSVATERVGAVVYAVERDPQAMAWLRRNVEVAATAAGSAAAAQGAGPETVPVTAVSGDATDPGVLAELDGTVDLVLCNPPYVPTGTPVAPEVAAHDPAVAVFAGHDGLAVIPGIVRRVALLLRPGGWFAVEHDDSNGDAVAGLLRADGRFDDVVQHNDLAGRPRYVTARRGLADWVS